MSSTTPSPFPASFTYAAKAYVALAGSIVAVLLKVVPPDNTLFTVLSIIAAVLTAVATYLVPNSSATTVDESDPDEVDPPSAGA